MSAISFSGAGLSTQLLHAMDDLSRELRTQARERAENEADTALREGLAEANEMRAKADDERTGAIVAGSLTAVGGLAQVGSAACMNVPDSGASAEQLNLAKMRNDRLGAIGQAGGSVGQIGKISQDFYGARGTQHDASAREHAARAQAASRRADAAQSEAQEAQRGSSKARDLHQQILEMEHSARMAVLRG